MKKYLILSAAITTVMLFTYSAKSETVVSSTAMTMEEMQSQMESLRASQNTMPTMPPFPNMEVQIPQIRPPQLVQIPINPTTPSTASPQPTTLQSTPSSVPAVTPTSSPAQRPTTSPSVIPSETPVASSVATATPSPTVKPTQAATKKPSTPAPVVQENADLTNEVIRLVNIERSNANLTALTKNASLTNSAQKYAQYMANANFFSHDGQDGSSYITRNKAAGYTNYRWMGENIAAGQSTAQDVMKAWMASSGHKANILSTKAKEIGVGYATNNSSTYKKYWVQEFGAR